MAAEKKYTERQVILRERAAYRRAITDMGAGLENALKINPRKAEYNGPIFWSCKALDDQIKEKYPLLTEREEWIENSDSRTRTKMKVVDGIVFRWAHINGKDEWVQMNLIEPTRFSRMGFKQLGDLIAHPMKNA